MNSLARLEVAHLMIKQAAKWDKLLRAGELRTKDLTRLQKDLVPASPSNIFHNTDRKEVGQRLGAIVNPGKMHEQGSLLREVRQTLREPEQTARYFARRESDSYGARSALKTRIMRALLPRTTRLA